MPGIFITYRREDSRADAGRLAKDLKGHLDGAQIFRDIDAIEPGADFVTAINSAVGSCSALLAIIGPNWLTVKDEAGRPRLEHRQDYVRLEIEVALNRDIRVIPILVGGAAMPRETDLPDSVSPLARRQAHELSESRWDYDVERLATTLETIPGIKKREPGQEDPVIEVQAKAPTKRFGVFVGAAVLSAMGVLFLLAGLIEGQALAFVWAAVFLGGAYWLFSKR